MGGFLEQFDELLAADLDRIYAIVNSLSADRASELFIFNRSRIVSRKIDWRPI